MADIFDDVAGQPADIFDEVATPSNGEIRNPRFQMPALAPGFMRSLGKPSIFGPIEPAVNLAGDLYHDVMTGGKTALEQGFANAPGAESIGSRFRSNLRDTSSMGQTLATKRAQELIADGTPADKAALLAGIQGGGLDAASFLASGGAGLAEDVVRGGAGVIKNLRQSKPDIFERIAARQVEQAPLAEQAPLDFEQWMGRPDLAEPTGPGGQLEFTNFPKPVEMPPEFSNQAKMRDVSEYGAPREPMPWDPQPVSKDQMELDFSRPADYNIPQESRWSEIGPGEDWIKGVLSRFRTGEPALEITSDGNFIYRAPDGSPIGAVRTLNGKVSIVAIDPTRGLLKGKAFAALKDAVLERGISQPTGWNANFVSPAARNMIKRINVTEGRTVPDDLFASERVWGKPRRPAPELAETPFGPLRAQEQQEFPFVKDLSQVAPPTKPWWEQPAAPTLSFQDLVAQFKGQGLSSKGAEKLAKQELGIQDIVPKAPEPRPLPPGEPLFDQWHADTQELVNLISENMPAREHQKLLDYVYAGDNAVAEGNLAKAVDHLEGLRGKVDDETFAKLDEVINKFKGNKEPLVVPPDAFDLADEAMAADAMAKKSKGVRDVLKAASQEAAALRKQAFNPKQALSDLKDIMEGEGVGLSTKTPQQLAKAEAARKRFKEVHVPAVLELMRTTGMNAAEALKSVAPEYTDGEIAELVKHIKVGNLFIDPMSPDVKKTTIENAPIAKRPVIKDTEVEKALGSTDVQEEMMRIAEQDPKLFAAAGRQAENMAEQMMRLAKNNPAQAEKYRTEAVDYLWRLSKIRHTAGLMLRHAGQRKASEDFIMMLEQGLQKGEFTGADAQLVADAIRSARKLQPKVLKSINNGIQEYGINMMLYNTDTAMRNVLGQAIGTVLNPIERAANAVTTAGLRAARVSEAKLKNVTEMQEILPSLGAGLKAVPGAVRSGIKMFVHETPKGIAESYAVKAKGIRRALNAGKITPEQAKEAIAKLQGKKRKLQADFQLQEDMSSLGFSTDRALRSKNPILDKAGKLVNVGTRALKATDLANSQIIKAMEETAARVRKQVQMARAGERGKVKLSADDRNQIIENTLHYSIRQHMPKAISGVYKAINSNFVSGLTLPFVRAQIALPRFAGQRSPLALGSIGSNLVGTLRGKEQFDTMQLTRAVTGTAMAYGAWAYLKSKGVEFHGAALDPKEQAMRKATKTPMGIYMKFKDGSMKGVGDIAPVSYVFGALAGIDEMYRNREKGMSTKDSRIRAAADAMQNIGSGTIFTSVRDIVKATEAYFKEAGEGSRDVYPGINEGERLDRSAAENWWQRKLTSVTVPRVTAQAQREGWLQEKDKTYRSPRDLGEEYKNAIGFGLQKSVPEQKNVFGQAIERPENQGPIDEVFGLGGKGNQDPAIELFNRVGWYPEPPAKTQDGLRVSNDKRMAMLEKFGPAVHKIALKLANNSSFSALPVRQQRDFLKEVVGEVFSAGSEINKAKSIKQIQGMSPEQKRALQYELKDASTDVVAGWGLNPMK